MGEITRILNLDPEGNGQCAENLLAEVYDELRRLAARKLSSEAPGQTLQPTALVHEAWLRLSGSNHQQWRGRAHFFGAAAEAMRRILIDQARRKGRQKRGGGIGLEEFDESCLEIPGTSEGADILAVNEALDALAVQEPLTAQVVKLRYFVGMTVPEIAAALEISTSTVERHWAYARAWLRVAVSSGR